MDAIQEKAREVGRLIAQTDEYKALKRANQRICGRPRGGRRCSTGSPRWRGSSPPCCAAGASRREEQQQEYESLLEEVQQQTVYQAMVAAQANFDRLMMRVNEEIARGIEAGEQSRIILPVIGAAVISMHPAERPRRASWASSSPCPDASSRAACTRTPSPPSASW